MRAGIKMDIELETDEELRNGVGEITGRRVVRVYGLDGEDVLSRVNAEIEAGRLRNRGGEPVKTPLREALVREDGRVLYPVDDGIPVMLIEESIELPQAGA